MNIKSESLIDQIEFVLNKNISEVNLDDLKLIKKININRFDINKKINTFDFTDLLYFNSLNEINFYDFEINNELINILFSVKSLSTLSFTNCDFIDDINLVFNNINILKINYCKNFNSKFYNSFPNIVQLDIKGDTLVFLPNSVLKLNMIDSHIDDYSIFDNLNLEEILISYNEYYSNLNFYNNLNTSLKVLDKNNCYFITDGDEYDN